MPCGGIRSQEKKTTRYQEQDQQKVAAYQAEIKDIPPEKIVYVDESGIDTYLYREYGYAPRGQQVFGQVRGRKYQRCGIVAAQMGDRILAPFQYNGTMDSRLFEFWFSSQLLPSLAPGTVIVMDNASFHSKIGYFLLPKMPDAEFCFSLPTLRNSIPLNCFGLG